jgi:hypothetical protein
MADQDSRGSFWTSLPGVLTGAAALVTAVSGLAIWHSNSASQPAPQPAPVVQQQTPQTQTSQPSSQASATPSAQANAAPAAATDADPGSQPWCAAKYKAWADEKAQTGVDDAGLRKEIIGQHCNTKYGFVLGKVKQQ